MVWDFVTRVAKNASIKGEVLQVDPTMGGEDFSFYLQAAPGSFILLGQGSGGSETNPDTSYGLHHPRFSIDEDVLDIGAALHAHLAFQSLDDLNGEAYVSSTDYDLELS